MENSTTPALHTDRYELTMLNAALGDGTSQRRATFEVFARFLAEGRDFGVVAGIELVILLQANGAMQFDRTLYRAMSSAIDFDSAVMPSFAAE